MYASNLSMSLRELLLPDLIPVGQMLPPSNSPDPTTPPSATTPPGGSWPSQFQVKLTLTDVVALVILLMLLLSLWKYFRSFCARARSLCCCCDCCCRQCRQGDATELRLVMTVPKKEVGVTLWKSDLCPAVLELIADRAPTGVSLRGSVFPALHIAGLPPVIKPKIGGLPKIYLSEETHVSPWKAFTLRRLMRQEYCCHYEWRHMKSVYKIVIASQEVDPDDFEQNLDYIADSRSLLNNSIIVV